MNRRPKNGAPAARQHFCCIEAQFACSSAVRLSAVEDYLGFCDGEGRAQASGCITGSRHRTFLHETAVSLPQLWPLSNRLPANGLPLGGHREGMRPDVRYSRR